jgi:predicted transcriptional regulator
MNDEKTYVELPDEVVDKLEEILLYLEDGRVYLAREHLEQLLGVEHKDLA